MKQLHKTNFLEFMVAKNKNFLKNQKIEYLRLKRELDSFNNIKAVGNSVSLYYDNEESSKLNMISDAILNLSTAEHNYLCLLLEDKHIEDKSMLYKEYSDNEIMKQNFLALFYNNPDIFQKLIGKVSVNAPKVDKAITENNEVKEEPKKVEKNSFNLKLSSFEASKKLSIIKEIKTLFGLGLKESKELVEKSPVIIKENVPKKDAEDLKSKLEKIGCKIDIE